MSYPTTPPEGYEFADQFHIPVDGEPFLSIYGSYVRVCGARCRPDSPRIILRKLPEPKTEPAVNPAHYRSLARILASIVHSSQDIKCSKVLCEDCPYNMHLWPDVSDHVDRINSLANALDAQGR